jgi:hypothetical protein
MVPFSETHSIVQISSKERDVYSPNTTLNQIPNLSAIAEGSLIKDSENR